MKRILFGVFLLFFCFCMQVEASEIEDVEDTVFKAFDFGEVNQVLEDILPEEKMDFGETVRKVIKGDVKFSVELLEKLVTEQLFYEFRENKKTVIHILMIAIIAAVFTNFSNVFQNRQIGEISFYVLYLLLITICLSTFQILIDGVGVHLERLTSFMRVLGPLYFLAVAISTGSGTSVIFYNLLLFLIYIVELLILNFLLPLLHIYMVIRVLNNLSTEEYLSKFAELIEFIVTWTLKTLLAAIIGLNVIQGLISPALDSLKRGMLTKSVEAIPAIGDALGGTAEIVLGTAVLVKNGIGVTGAIICIVLCVIPLLQMFVMAFLYKLTSAFIQPISDKRIVGCVSGMGEGCQILLRVIFTTGMLFLLTIAIVTATTT
ncbi:MAG: stage III sporulation protein AE [Lachnospiraceae bacterium]|nr:stage III sporulation protein AE [Lachnospiraceae bacterium]